MAFLAPLFIIHLLALMTPGPDFLIVSKTAMASSRRTAMITALGVTVGVAIWVALVLLGLHVLFKQFAWIQTIIKLAGGAYLVYLGVQMMKAAFHPVLIAEASSTPLERSGFAAFFSGLLTNLSNPKVIIYFGSIFATFLTNTVSITNKLAIFTLVTTESLMWFLLLAFLFSLPVPRRAYQRANRWIDGIAGVAFSGFGLRLLLTSQR